MRPEEPLLRVEGVTKQFSGVKALDAVDLTFYRGEIHALLGENGAGKSTLIKILSGIHVPDGGTIKFNGEVVVPNGRQLSISFIHQDLGLVDNMTVAENVAIVTGYERTRGLISWRKINRRALEILESMDTQVDPEMLVGSLSAAEKSLVAIARALAIKADLLVLDEPTASLPEADVSRLLSTLTQLKQREMGIIFVTHRIDEVFRAADMVSVLRDGRHVGTMSVGETDVTKLVELITGRSISETYVPPPVSHRRQTRFEVSNLSGLRVGPLSFKIAQGEVLGLAGVRGAGHELVGRILFGDIASTGGTVKLDGTAISPTSCEEAISAEIGYISSNRIEENIAPELTVRENLFPNPKIVTALPRYIRRRTETRACEELMHNFGVRPPDGERVILTLSGGNQQKVILARWLALNIKLLILQEPTRGVDVGAKAEIYRLLREQLRAGLAILLISSDFEEVVKICHRALVFHRGRIVAEIPEERLSEQELTSAAAGTPVTLHQDGTNGRSSQNE